MSLVNVILAANRLQIAGEGDDILLDSVTYTNIVSVNPLVATKKDEVGFVPGLGSNGYFSLPTTENIYWRVQLHLADGRKEYIFLEDVDNQAGWTNDAAGYAAAEEDIYAAFPTGGGGGGTVTSVGASGGTTGFGFSGSPVTGSGTLTLTVSNAATARAALGLPKFYFGSISQAGTAAPTVTTGGNTVGAIVWTRNDVGSYTGTLAGAFPLGSGGYVSVNTEGGFGFNDQPFAFLSRQDDDVLILNTGTIDAAQDDILSGAFIHITTP